MRTLAGIGLAAAALAVWLAAWGFIHVVAHLTRALG